MIVCNLFLWLIFYSFAGWVYETILCSITQKKFVNRGFLNGPLCPIYGCGAILLILVLSPIRNPVILFLAGMLLTCSVEYFTSWLLEKLFHAKWWDYSEYRFQINGRVCLAGALVFGAFSVVLLLWIHPFVRRVTEQIPPMIRWIAFGLLLAAFLTDCVFTVLSILRLNGRLQQVQAAVTNFFSESGEWVHSLQGKLRTRKRYTELLESLSSRLSRQEKRFLRAFPKLRSTNYNDALQRLKESLLTNRKKRK